MTPQYPSPLSGELEEAKRVDLRTAYMREVNDLPDNWRWVQMEVLDHQRDPKDWRYTQWKGAVYSTLITRGKRKGQPNTRKPDEGTYRIVVTDEHAYKAWLPAWEARTGKCHVCKGTGKRWRGWTATEGNKYDDCPRCEATGIAPTARSLASDLVSGDVG